MKNQELDASFHAVYKLTYHLVMVTKYRKKVITKEILSRIKEITSCLFSKYECILIEFSGEEDHVHILFQAHPAIKLSALVNNLKTVSSRRVRKEFKDHVLKYYWKPHFWSRSYFIVSAGGAPLSVIKQYIKSQKKL